MVIRARCLLAALVMCVLTGTAPAVAGAPTFYVCNVKVEKPFVRQGAEVYLPAETIVKLFRPAVTRIEKGTTGARVNGQDTPVQTIEQGGRSWFPVSALARHLGWEVRVNRELDIVDVSSPRSARVARAATADVPLDPREEAMANRGEQEVLRLYGPMSANAELIARVESIGRKVVATCDRSGIRWRFFVVESKEVQAISVGGGRVYVTRGLLRLMNDTDLAGVVAHEVGHGSRLHSTRVLDTADTGKYWLRVADEARRKQQEIVAEYQAGRGGSEAHYAMRYRSAQVEEAEALEKARAAAASIKQSRSREGRWEQEYEADRMGMMYLARAGYHPMVMVYCLQTLAKHTNAQLDSSLYQGLEASSTHPPLQQRVQIAQSVYQQYFDKKGDKR